MAKVIPEDAGQQALSQQAAIEKAIVEGIRQGVVDRLKSSYGNDALAKADDAKAQKTMSDFIEQRTKEHLDKEKERLQAMRAEIAKSLLESVRNAPQVGKMFAMPSELKLGDDGPGPTFEAMPKWAMGAGSALHGFETMNAPETIATPAPGDIVLVKGQSGLADGLYVVGPLGEFVPHPQGFMPMSKPKFILKCTRKIELEGSECGVDFQMPIRNLSQQATVSLKGLTKAEIDEFTVGESYRLQFKPVPRKPEPAPDRDYTPSMFGDDRPGKGTRPFDESQDIRDYGKGK